MGLEQSLIAFSVAAALLTIAPGPDTFLVLRNAFAGGARQAMAAGLGVGLGLSCWGILVATGVAALIAASPVAYGFLKLIGALYLIWLGLTLIASRRTSDTAPSSAAPKRRPGLAEAGGAHSKDLEDSATANIGRPQQRAPASLWLALRRGFLTNMLNPKVGVFYVAFLPQFIPTGADAPILIVLMTGVHALMGLIWFACLIAASTPISRAFSSRPFTLWLDRLMGAAFIAFGLRLALQER
jgi:threonine/homoserine/homoserine lactone efflux protein